MDEQPVLNRIESLVDEEHRLWQAGEAGGLDDAQRERLHVVETELEACWAALRGRRAGSVGAPPADEVPDPSNELDGPDPEPPHLEHGTHGDGPAPDPDVSSNAP